MPKLILNADDFGMSPLFDKAILELIEEWSLRSTSVMVTRISISQKDQIDKLMKFRTEWKCSVWLHFEFVWSNCDHEIQKQITHFQKILGVMPDHMDVHKFDYNDWFDRAIDWWWDEMYRRNISRNWEWTTTYECISATKNSLPLIYTYIDSIKENESWELRIHPWFHDPYILSSLWKKREDDIEKCRAIT